MNIEPRLVYDIEVYEQQYLATLPYYVIFVETYDGGYWMSPQYDKYDEALEVYKSVEYNWSVKAIALYCYRFGDEYCMIKTEKL